MAESKDIPTWTLTLHHRALGEFTLEIPSVIPVFSQNNFGTTLYIRQVNLLPDGSVHALLIANRETKCMIMLWIDVTKDSDDAAIAVGYYDPLQKENDGYSYWIYRNKRPIPATPEAVEVVVKDRINRDVNPGLST